MIVLHFDTFCQKPGRFKRSHALGTGAKGGIPTTTAGGLWGAYLMTVAHFYKELASRKQAIS